MEVEKMSLEEFCGKVAEKTPTPGGGAVGAVVGAMACALAEMVANFTRKKRGYEDVEAEMERIVEDMEELRERLFILAGRDMKAFEELMNARRLPEDSEEERMLKRKKVEEAILEAASVPLDVIRAMNQLARELEILAEFGNRNLFSDTLNAVDLCEAVYRVAKVNVLINVKEMENEKTRKEFLEELEELGSQIEGSCRRIREMLEVRLWNSK